MNNLTILNKDIKNFLEFLDKLEITNGRASRGRSKLIKLISRKFDEYQEEIAEIRMPYFEKDKDGKPLVDGNYYVFKKDVNKNELNKLLTELGNDEAIVDYSEYAQKMEELYHFLEDLSMPLKETDAGVYDIIMDSFEESFDRGGE